MSWEKYCQWSMWIVGGRYITALSMYRSFEEVLTAVTEEAERLGIFATNAPTVLVNNMALYEEQCDFMKNLPEGHVSIILE